MRVVPGFYDSTLADRTLAIRGVGIAAADWRALIIKGGANHSVIRLNTMATDSAKNMASGTASIAGAITGLVADGFDLGGDARVNSSTPTRYYWLALADDGSNDIATGTYTGTGAAHDITGLFTFTAEMVLALNPTTTATVRWRPEILTGDQSLNFSNQGVVANMLVSLLATGFRVGTSSDVNTNTATYHWLALASQAGICETITYTGDGVEDRELDGLLTFQPSVAFIKGVGATHGRARYGDMTGDLSTDFAASAPGTGAIKAFRPTGFLLGGTSGAADRVNFLGTTYYALALGSGSTGGAFPAPTNLVASASGATAIDLSLTDNTTDEEGFEFWRSTDQVNWTLQNTNVANDTTYTNSGLATTTLYYYRARAVKASGTVFSEYSNIASATTGGASSNALTLGTLDLGATYETATIEQHYTGDANRNATCPEAVLTTTGTSALGATSIALSAALPFALPDNSLLPFFNGTRIIEAVLNGAHSLGATSLTVDALPAAVAAGSTAWITGVQFKRTADPNWRFGQALRRVDVDVTGAEIADAKGRAFYGVLLELANATTYDLRLRFTDADGITGTNPVVTTVTTRTDAIAAHSALAALTNRYVSTAGSDITGDGLTLATAWRTPAQAVARYTAGDSPANWYVQLVGGAGGAYFPAIPDIIGTNGARSLCFFGTAPPATTNGVEANTGDWVVIEPGQKTVQTASGLPFRYLTGPTGAADTDIPTAYKGPWFATTIAGQDTTGAATGRTYSVYRWPGCPLEPRNMFGATTRNAFPTRIPWWERTALTYASAMSTSTPEKWAEAMFWEGRSRNEGHLYGFWSDGIANVTVASPGAAAGATSIPLTAALGTALPDNTILRCSTSSGLGPAAVYAQLNGAHTAAATSLTVDALSGAVATGTVIPVRTVYCRIYDPDNDGLATTITHAGINPNTLYLRFSDYQQQTMYLDAPNIRISGLFIVGGESGIKVRAGATDYIVDHCGLTASYWPIEHLGTKPDTFGTYGTIEHNWFKHSASYGYPRHNGVVGWNCIKNSLGRNAEQASLIHFKGGSKWVTVRHNRLTDTFDCIGLNPDALVATGTAGFTRYAAFGLHVHNNVLARAADDGIDEGKQAVCTVWHDNITEDMPCFFSPGPTKVGPIYIYRNTLWRSSPRGTGRSANGYAELQSGKFFKFSKDSNPNAQMLIAHNTHFTDLDSTDDTFFVGAAGIGLQHAGGGNLNETFLLWGNIFRCTYNVHNATTSNNIGADDYNLYATADATRGFLLNYAGGGGDLTTIAAYRASLAAVGATLVNPNGSVKAAHSNQLSGVDFDFGAEATLDSLLTDGPNGNLAMVAVVPMPVVPNVSDQAGVDYVVGSAPTIGWYVPSTTVPAGISNVVATPAGSSVTITWTTGVASSSQVEYGLVPGPPYAFATVLDPTQVTSHSVTINGLLATTEYHFRPLSWVIP